MSKKEEKIKYYTLDNILLQKADYNVIYGERSNGKTTAVLAYALREHVSSNYVNQLAIVRRWDEDFKDAKSMYDGILALGWVKEFTHGDFNGVYYYSRKWFLCNYNEEGKRVNTQNEPFAIGFSIGTAEHYKSLSFPRVTIILFDEFLTRELYLDNEFIRFQNLLSTIIRNRDNIIIFMCGNSVNKYAPYFNEMGLTNVKRQKQGTIDLYTYGESGLRVAVEYSDFPSKKKASNKYFAFNNPRLNMITTGAWEIDIYPHMPLEFRREKDKPKNTIYIFYVIFDKEILEGNIFEFEDKVFLYFHRKTSPIHDNEDKRLIYQQEVDYRNNYRVNITTPYGKADTKIWELFKRKKVFYQDNEVGEVINNYLKWCMGSD